MNLRIKSILLSLVSAVVLMVPLKAGAAIDVAAKLDSVYLQMGRITTLHLTVTQPKGTKGAFPLLQQVNQSGVIPVCNDSVELRAPSRVDTVDAGANQKITFDVPLQAFDSGFYQLPQFVYVAGKDSVKSKILTLKVLPVKASAQDQIYDYAGTADPENPSIFDHLPDWIVDFWWLILLIILAALVFAYGMKRYKTEGHLLPRKPEPTPYEKAMTSLRTLKEQKLWEQGMEKDYYTQLTEILRTYLYGRFHINAMEMTSRQILSAIGKEEEIKSYRPSIRQILDMADFVKFAKVRPLPEDNVKAYDNALQFVRDTKPKPVEPQTDGANGTAIVNPAKTDTKDSKSLVKRIRIGKGGER